MSTSKEVDRLTQVCELASSIREKYETLKRNEHQFQMKQERTFKPILKKSRRNFQERCVKGSSIRRGEINTERIGQ